MKAAVSTACFYPMLLEDEVRELCSHGVKDIEIFINTHSETTREFIGELKKVTDSYGVNVVSIHPYTCGIEPMMLFTEYERRFDDMVEYYKRFFEICNLFGAKIFVLHGNKPVNKVPEKLHFERFGKLHRIGKQFGVSVAQENVERCNAGKLSVMKKMTEYLGDDVEFVLDTKQAIRAGEDIFNIVDTLGDRIVHVHYSDNTPEKDCLLFGRGSFDFEKFKSKLAAKGFDGALTLEVYRGDFKDADELAASYELMRKRI